MKNNIFTKWLPLAGLLSWPLALVILLIATLFVTGSDRGWAMMGMGYSAFGVIVIVNLISIIGTVFIWRSRKAQHEPVGIQIKIGLVYFGLILAAALIIEGPFQLVEDSAVMVKALFHMKG